MLERLKQEGLAPEWMDIEGYELVKKYLAYDELTPSDLYHRLAKTAANHLGMDFYSPLYEVFWRGYLSPSTPVATNFGAYRITETGEKKFRALPVSCFGLKPHNSIDGIFKTAHESAMLSKNGGGLGINLSDLIGESPVTAWGKLYDLTAKIVSQGGVRRGAAALYLRIDHPDIEAFLHAKDMLNGDPREKFDSNIAVIIPDSFIEQLKAGDAHAKKVFAKVLELRMKQGSPYIFFVDNANRQKGIDYEALGLDINTSQLCNEIALYCDELHTYVCVLSSVVASRYDEFKNRTWLINGQQWSVPMLGIAFLDAVTEEFIRLGNNLPGLENAVRFAEKSRALGLGLLGWHTLLQKHFLPFHSEEAYSLNEEIWQFMQKESVKASLILGEQLGIPEWCQTSKQRHTHLLAIAPTLANSVLSAAGSPSIEPIASNEYMYVGANGNYLRKNIQLEEHLENLGLNTPDVWALITADKGSVQCLGDKIAKASGNDLAYTERFLDVFKTAYEIDQQAIIKQAADRQKYICQGQSVNLFITHDANAQEVANFHIQAWKLGLKGLYYIRSTSPRSKPTTVEADKPVHTWHIETREGCPYCSKAKSLLRQLEKSFTETQVDTPPVSGITYPRIWMDSTLIGGYTELVEYFHLDTATEELQEDLSSVSCGLKEDECIACQG